MSFGLKTNDSSGNNILSTDTDRLGRIVATYSYNVASGQTTWISIPNFVDDGTWSVITVATNPEGFLPIYYRGTGQVGLQNIFYITMYGYIIILRY